MRKLTLLFLPACKQHNIIPHHLTRTIHTGQQNWLGADPGVDKLVLIKSTSVFLHSVTLYPIFLCLCPLYLKLLIIFCNVIKVSWSKGLIFHVFNLNRCIYLISGIISKYLFYPFRGNHWNIRKYFNGVNILCTVIPTALSTLALETAKNHLFHISDRSFTSD